MRVQNVLFKMAVIIILTFEAVMPLYINYWRKCDNIVTTSWHNTYTLPEKLTVC